MPAGRQLQLDDRAAQRGRRRAVFARGLTRVSGATEALGGRLLYWAPVWLPLILLAQLAVGGLRPALAETRRLDAAERNVAAFEFELAEDARVLDANRRCLVDPIYRERVKKSLTVAGKAPLRLADVPPRPAPTTSDS